MTSPGGGTRQVRIVISADVASAIRGFRDVEGGLGRVGQQGEQAQRQTSGFSDALRTGLGAAGIVGGFTAIVGGFQQVISTGLDYEKSIHTFQAVTGASADVMQQMGDTAKALGNDVKIPGASAQSTAAAMTELAKGGLTAQQSMDAARGTMILAAAAQIDGAKAAEIQANALNTFGLKASEAGRVANVLANVANKSSGEISDFALGLSQAGTVANSFGWSIEDTTTMLGLMANAGIKGSDAGTSLKTTMTAMLNPTDTQTSAMEQLGLKIRDANGHMISARDFTAQLTAAKGRMSEADFGAAAAQAFGTDAVRTGLVAAQAGTKGFDDMAGSLTNVTGASDVAAANSQGLTGALDRVSNTASTLALTIYENLAPALTSIVDMGVGLISFLGDAVGWFTNLPGPVQAVALAIGGVVLLNGPLKAMFAAMVAGAGSVLAPLASMRMAMATQRELALANGTSMGVMSAAMRVAGVTAVTVGQSMKAAFLSNPIGLAIIGVTTAMSFLSSSTDDASVSAQDYTDVVDEQTGALKENAAQLISAKVEASGLGDKWRALGGDTSVLVDAIGRVPGKLEEANKFLADQKQAALDATAALSGVTGATNDYTGAAGGVAAANAGAALSFNQTATAAGQQSTGYKTATEAGDLFNQQVGLMTGALDTQQHTAEGASGALGAQDAATRGAGAAAAGATQPTADLAGALKAASENAQLLADNTSLSGMLAGFKAGADEASRAADLFKVALDGLDGRSRSLDDATAAQQKTLSALTSAWEAGTKAATKNTDAGNLNVQALTDWNVKALTATSDGAKLYDELGNMADQHMATAAAAYSDAVAHGDVAGAAEIARQTATDSRQAFLELATQHGLNTEQAAVLADKLGIVDGAKIDDKFFKTINDDADAQAKLKAAKDAVVQDKLFKINGDASDALTNLAAVRAAIAAVPDSKIVRVQVDRGDLLYTTSSGAQFKAGGGWVHGAGGPTDDKVALRASPKEFVVNAAQAQKHAGLLEAINAGTMGFAEGGVVPAVSGTGAAASVAVASTVSVPDVGAIEKAWAAIAAAVQNAWASIIGPALDALTVATAKTAAVWVALQTVTAEPVWATIGAVVRDTVNGVLLPGYAALDTGTLLVGRTMVDLLNGAVVPVWSQTGALISNTWGGPIAGTYAALNAGSGNVGANFQQLAGTTNAMWSQIGGSISGTYNGQIIPAWNGVQGFANATGGFFTGLAAGVGAARAQVTGDVGRITTAVDDFFKMVDGKAPPTPGAAAVAAGVVPRFADGGLITAGTGPRTDDVHIRASRGEYVVNARSTAANRAELDRINYGGAFADGGVVGEKIGNRIGDAIIGGAQKAIEAGITRVLAAVPAGGGGFTSNGNWGPENYSGLAANTAAARDFVTGKWGISNIGGFGGGSVSTSDHPKGKALDVMIANYKTAAGIAQGTSVADWFTGNPNSFGTKYVIWRDRINEGGSWSPYSHPSGNNDTLQHRDHVHISFLTGTGAFTGRVTAPAADDNPAGGGWLGSMLAKIKAGGTAASAPGTVGYNATAGVEQWRALALQALAATGQDPSNIDRMLHQMQTESSGNPNAVNLTDINAQRGYPSRGLLQVIQPTFESSLRGTQFENLTPRGTTDPWANMIASILYGVKRYGSLTGAYRGVAYDNGGMLGPGWNFNGSGTPEPVLTDRQWAVASAAMNYTVSNAGGGRAGPVTVNFRAFIGDREITDITRIEVDNAFVQLTTDLNRQRVQAI